MGKNNDAGMSDGGYEGHPCRVYKASLVSQLIIDNGRSDVPPTSGGKDSCLLSIDKSDQTITGRATSVSAYGLGGSLRGHVAVLSRSTSVSLTARIG